MSGVKFLVCCDPGTDDQTRSSTIIFRESECDQFTNSARYESKELPLFLETSLALKFWVLASYPRVLACMNIHLQEYVVPDFQGMSLLLFLSDRSREEGSEALTSGSAHLPFGETVML